MLDWTDPEAEGEKTPRAGSMDLTQTMQYGMNTPGRPEGSPKSSREASLSPARTSSSDSLSQSIDQIITPSLSKSSSNASARYSVRSCKSVRYIGNLPIGALTLSRSDSLSQSESASRLNPIDCTKEEASAPPCLEKGDIFCLNDIPPGFVIGHDDVAMTFQEAKSVIGFRDVPAGPHFLWIQGKTSGLRCGYWYITNRPGVIRVKQWDKTNEVLGEPGVQYLVRELKENIGAIYPQLHPYNNTVLALTSSPQPKSEPLFMTSANAMWRQLTDAISGPFLDRVTSKKRMSEWYVDSTDAIKGESFSRGNLCTSQVYKATVASELDFLFSQDIRDLNILDVSLGIPGEFDTTPRVMGILNTVSDQDIVAELQFTFVTGTHIGNVACIEQWWDLVLRIILRAIRLALDRPALCRWLLRTIHAQLVYTERNVQPGQEDLVASTDSTGPSRDRLLFQVRRGARVSLRSALAEYKRRLNSELLLLGTNITPAQKEVGLAFNDLEDWLWRTGWDLRSSPSKEPDVDIYMEDLDDCDDDMPVVVHLDSEGREKGLVSFHHD